MKELSIEEKAKRYDEAFGRAKEWSETKNGYYMPKEFCEEIFPEFKESEDEKIRKELLAFVQDRKAKYPNDPKYVNIDAWIDWLENQGEQKPANKVEPRFHEGDWVVSPNGVYWHIDAIQDGRYHVSSDLGKRTDWSLDANIYHKFTIQDAKPGDVLVASDKSLFIYDGSINENGSVGFHIAFAKDTDIILNSDDGCGWEEKDSCHPATKEQRDQLEKAMADAGYSFNFEKKKLKKIEQKPAWSEEDEVKMNRIVACLENLNVADNDILLKDVDWLKSLRPQSQWKPSDEQMDELRKYSDNVVLRNLYYNLKKLKVE